MRIFLGIVWLLSFQWGNAQKQLPKISLSFTNATKKEVLHQIEEKSDFHFFYLDQWLGSEKISGDYKEIPLDEVLTAIFKDTEVNFYVLSDTQIVLTRNNVIYDTLPEGFFGNEENSLPAMAQDGERETVAPIFYKEEKSARKTVNTEIVRIGKENKRAIQNRYILMGYVTNAKTGEPIGNLSIRIKNTNNGVSTDDEGFYRIELSPGLNILETRSLGIEDSQKN